MTTFITTAIWILITASWWTCSCGHSNPAGIVTCEVCYKSK